MFKKSVPIIFIGLSIVVAMLVLGWVVFVKTDDPVQVPVVSDGDGKVISDDLSNNDISGVDISDWKTYRNEEFGFEIKYPEDWDNKNSESVILFSENGPVGSRFGFRATEKDIYESPFWVNVYCIPDIENIGELEYFDFAHSGDKVYHDGYDIIKIGHTQEEFFRIKNKTGSFVAYIKIRNRNYFQISYHDPGIDNLRDETEQLLSTFKFTK
ncbi:MAG: hypothetical protein KAQ87_01300 [Candidatus Pacebacteria bacterium]|nr:hypothetical protein [Candidatus Paceibacterota bacterium]